MQHHETTSLKSSSSSSGSVVNNNNNNGSNAALSSSLDHHLNSACKFEKSWGRVGSHYLYGASAAAAASVEAAASTEVSHPWPSHTAPHHHQPYYPYPSPYHTTPYTHQHHQWVSFFVCLKRKEKHPLLNPFKYGIPFLTSPFWFYYFIFLILLHTVFLLLSFCINFPPSSSIHLLHHRQTQRQ